MNDRDQRLREVARIAVALEVECGLPAPLLIAQWAVESKWGAKPVGQANYFGIKAHCAGKTCTVTTHEAIDGALVPCQQTFADYGSLEESCRDYAWLITKGVPYRQAWREYQAGRDLPRLIAAVAGTYATNPNYAGLVSTVACQKNVADAVAAARREAANVPG